MDRSRWLRYGLYVLLFVVVRARLLEDFPAVLTGDSWDFLGSARSIAAGLDFSEGDVGLRDCRIPGYPFFQAVFVPLTLLRSDRILLLQAALGLAVAGMAWGIGRALRAPWIGEVLALFVGLNPVYLLNEHAIMSEGLALAGLIAMAMVSIRGLRSGLDARLGVVLGLLSGANLLIRINSVLFCATMIAGLTWTLGRRVPAGSRARVIGGFLMAAGLSGAAVVGPWVWRNARIYHQFSLNMSQHRTLLIYKIMHHSFDPRLPVVSRECALLGMESVDYNWLWKLRQQHGTVGAERVAAEMLEEQRSYHPDRHLRDVLRSVACFGGWYERWLDDRSPIRYWFENLVGDIKAVDRIHEESRPLASELGFTYVPARGDSPWTRAWQTIGRAYLIVARPILFVGFFLARLWPRLRRWPRASAEDQAAARFLSLGYLATIAFHSLTLTDSDRFSSLYDWMALLVILMTVERWRRPAIAAA